MTNNKVYQQLDAIEVVASWLNGTAAACEETGQYTHIIGYACRKGMRYLQDILDGNAADVIKERAMQDEG